MTDAPAVVIHAPPAPPVDPSAPEPARALVFLSAPPGWDGTGIRRRGGSSSSTRRARSKSRRATARRGASGRAASRTARTPPARSTAAGPWAGATRCSPWCSRPTDGAGQGSSETTLPRVRARRFPPASPAPLPRTSAAAPGRTVRGDRLGPDVFATTECKQVSRLSWRDVMPKTAASSIPAAHRRRDRRPCSPRSGRSDGGAACGCRTSARCTSGGCGSSSRPGRRNRKLCLDRPGTP